MDFNIEQEVWLAALLWAMYSVGAEKVTPHLSPEGRTASNCEGGC